jgi:hypothetical protein
MANETKVVPVEITNQLRTWSRLARGLRLLHAGLGISAILCSLIVAAKIHSFGAVTIEWLSFSAAGSIGLLHAFDLGAKANRMRNAWRILNSSVMRFKETDSFSKEDLIKAYEDAEKVIGDVKEEPK